MVNCVQINPTKSVSSRVASDEECQYERNYGIREHLVILILILSVDDVQQRHGCIKVWIAVYPHIFLISSRNIIT